MILDRYLSTPERTILVGAGVSVLLLAGAHAFEHIGGLAPCPLCLDQREVHWAALTVAAVGFVLMKIIRNAWIGLATLFGLTCVFAYSAGLAAYHAGVEWKIFPAPPTCANAGGPMIIENPADLLGQLETAPIISCTDAAWRLFGISMAGYNALISLALAGVMVFALWRFARAELSRPPSNQPKTV